MPSIAAVTSLHVAAYVEELTRRQKAPTVKQQLAAIRRLLDWLAAGGVIAFNPASAVRGPEPFGQDRRDPCPFPDRGPPAS